jgi:steroid delta-isomerase-like uncharacterized protein
MSKGTDFVNKWMDAVKRGDVDTLVAMSQPDSVHVSPDGTFRGAQGVRDLFTPMMNAVSEREVQINNVVESGDTIVVEFVFRFRHTGPIVTPQATIPPTGKTASLSSIGVYELRDGKLAGSRGMYDRLAMITQLGLMGAPAPS